MIGDLETLIQYAVREWAGNRLIAIQYEFDGQRVILAEACANTTLKRLQNKLAELFEHNQGVQIQLDVVDTFDWSETTGSDNPTISPDENLEKTGTETKKK